MVKPRATTFQLLAEVNTGCTLLLGRKFASYLGEVGACGLDQALDSADDMRGRLPLEGLGFQCLRHKLEDLCGLRKYSLVLPVHVSYRC
jgi:hypothetical protein